MIPWLLWTCDMIHKLGKDNVMLYALSHKEEYQGEMRWENIQILRAMFMEENNLKRNI